MSIFNKNWKLHDPAPREFLDAIPDISDITAQILWNRGIRKEKNIKTFLNPSYEKDLHDPFLMKDMDRAVERISKAIKENQKIFIYGDYDADGVCASTLLKESLEKLGADDVGVYIPHREEEGYGMSIAALDEVIDDGAELIITVDCGSTNVDEAQYAEDKGVDVVITDHHQVMENQRFSYALVNPHQNGDEYPFKDICGTAVAFKVVQALEAHMSAESGEPILQEGEEKWMLDLVGIATVTDVMPLVDENRAFVKYGLLVLAQSKRPGLRALMEVAGINPKTNKKERTTNLDSFHLGFMIGPRINAAGRMDHAQLAFNLLNSSDISSARKLAWELEDRNRERRKLVKDIISEIDESDLDSSAAIYQGRKHWPIGVLGIVAGRLAELYNKPSFIYQIQDGKIVGSVRTPEYANTVGILKKASSVLTKFGGHAQAGGFTTDPKNENTLGKNIEKIVKKDISNLKTVELKPMIKIDMELSGKEISWETYKSTGLCAPFGEANPRPIFALRGAIIQNINMVGSKEDHMKCDILTSKGKRFSAIGFRFADMVQDLKSDDKVDIAFEIDKNEWNGDISLQLKLVDIKKYE
ncbi:MAG: single-stranded-DNA-specific exonuclease RecJ [Candidatus Spechtbacterales bacterium]|nr:single-stranded-DNA-specific exonuclease RecJ [Candidatus Spechtbacterales bacterium]